MITVMVIFVSDCLSYYFVTILTIEGRQQPFLLLPDEEIHRGYR